MQVTGYDADTGEWVVEWLEGTTKERDTQLRLPRLRVYLKAEDPFNFADRVADAHASKEVGKDCLQRQEGTHSYFELLSNQNMYCGACV